MVLIKLSAIFILGAAAGAIIPVVALPTSWNKMAWHPWKERVDLTGPEQFASGNIPENSNNPTGRVFLRIPNSNFDLARSTSKRRKQDYESSNKPSKMGPSAPPSHRTEIHPGPSSRRVYKSSDNHHRTKKGKQIILPKKRIPGIEGQLPIIVKGQHVMIHLSSILLC